MTDKPTYRASSIYSCKKHLSAIRLGIEGDPDPPWLALAAEEGTIQEGIIKNKLRAEGIEVIDGRDVNGVDEDGIELPCPICLERFGSEDKRYGIHTEINTDLFDIVGHKDGEAREVVFKFKRLLEIKTMSGFEFPRYEREGWDGFGTYANQVAVYWGDYEEALYVIKNRSSGYTKKSYLQEPPRSIEGILAHITEVEKWCLEHDTPMEAEYDPKSIECKRCPFARVLSCIKEVKAKPADEKVLEDARKLWWKGKKMEDEGKVLQVGAKEVLTAHAKANGLEGETWHLKDICTGAVASV